jgi:hypothetical protein
VTTLHQKEKLVKYLLQVRLHAGALVPPSDGERDAIRAQYVRIRRDPRVLDAHQLQPADTATTVRVNAGRVEQTADLPLARTDALDGYYLFDAPDVEAAIGFAATIPAAANGGTIEIRPVLD